MYCYFPIKVYGYLSATNVRCKHYRAPIYKSSNISFVVKGFLTVLFFIFPHVSCCRNEYLIFQKIIKLEYEFPEKFFPKAKDLVKQLLVSHQVPYLWVQLNVYQWEQ